MKLGSVAEILKPDLIETGTWCHLRDPTDGEPLFAQVDGKTDRSKPLRIRVRSVLSEAFQNLTDQQARRGAADNRRVKSEAQRLELALKRIRDDLPQSFSVLAVDFENFGGEALQTPSDDDKQAIARASNTRWIAEQVSEHAADKANYGDAAGNPAAA
jgi:hypothetical protein